MFTLALAQMAMLSVQVAATPSTATISICDVVAHPRKFVAKHIRINAVMGFTVHGLFLLSHSCSRSDLPDAVVLTPKADNTPKVDFALDPQADQMLRRFYRPFGGTANACGIVTGQLFYKKNFRSKEFGAGPQGNGYGPRGAFPIAFVLQSVNEIRACERPVPGEFQLRLEI